MEAQATPRQRSRAPRGDVATMTYASARVAIARARTTPSGSHWARMLARGGLALVSVGCTGEQSTLDPRGPTAERIADLFWGMTFGGTAILIAVVGLALYAAYGRDRTRPSVKGAERLVILGGVAFPSVVLVGLLIYGLALLPDLLAPAPDGSLKIRISGEQWWWRIRYLPVDGEPFELANELRLPVGEPVEFELESPDVIHSFWIPGLGGKMDMIPGRTTRIALTASEVGTMRGVCAEYCGTSHALMAFSAVVLDKPAFERWSAEQRAPAREPTAALAKQGSALFLENGCGACHTVRGTDARGVNGPDLTHVGSRASLGAGILPNDESAFQRWIAHPDEVKPGVRMPAFGMLAEPSLRALAAYLESLK